MKPRKEPLSVEEEREICRKCNGFCCNYYFYNADQGKDAKDLHTFRKRKIIKYGKVEAIILQDKCPYSDSENHCCSKYKEPGFPNLCLKFPSKYRPFWNLRCKLMRVRYARGLIPKDEVGFAKLYKACGRKPKSPFKIYK